MDTVVEPSLTGYEKYRGIVKIILWIVIFIIGVLAFLFYPAFTNRDFPQESPGEITGDHL